MTENTKILIGLLILALLDAIIPFPIMAVIVLYVLWARPQWFEDLVTRVYKR